MEKIVDEKKTKALNRFNLPCLGKQDDFTDILKKRFQKYKELKNNKSSLEYKKWFFKYIPRRTMNHSKNKNNKTRKVKLRRGNNEK